MKRRTDTLSSPERDTTWASGPCLPGQAGAVLVVSLILLVVLTLLGLSAMEFTSLEEKMATSDQEANRAFHAAETGLTDALGDPDSLDLSSSIAIDLGQLGNTPSSVSYATTFRGWSNPPLGSLYSTGYSAAHFNVQSTGNSSAGATVVLDAGLFQITASGP